MTHDRISLNPDVMSGKPVIKGTRVPVTAILWILASGQTPDDVLLNYPHLTADDVKAALAYAADKLTPTGLVAAE